MGARNGPGPGTLDQDREVPNMNKSILPTLLLFAVAVDAQQSGTPRSDVLLMDRVDRTAHVPVPQRGLSMDRVKERYGAPERRVGPVGDPPITRWVYADYTVYFEGNRVIHAVVNRASDSEMLGP